MRILLITPPLTQLNTPYPSTAYLKGLFVAQGHEVHQLDLGIELADRVLSNEFLQSIGLEREAQLIEPVKRFLRGQDDTLGPRIANRSLLPEGKRFEQLDEDHLEWSFGVSGATDKAQHLASLFIEEVADYVREHVDPHFDLVRYAEYLSNDAPSFAPLYEELQRDPSPIDRLMLSILEEKISIFNF
ncbi:MAG: radical SAM protein, partial [Bacteroidales bacterium]|nr:radical SAM protein [Bacteroidales bacterium]